MNIRRALSSVSLALLVACVSAAQPAQQKPERIFVRPQHYFAGVIAYGPGGGQVVYDGPDFQLVVAEAGSGRVAREFRGHTNEVTSLTFSPDGRELASGGMDGTIRLWDWASGKLRHALSLQGRVTAVFGLAFSPQGDKVADVRSDSLISVWDARGGRSLFSRESGLKYLSSVTFSADGGALIVGGEREGGGGGVEVWRLIEGGAPIRTALPGRVTALTLIPRGDELLVGDVGGAMRILNWKSGAVKTTWKAHDAPIREVRLSPAGGLFATAVSWEDPGVKLWSLADPTKAMNKLTGEMEGSTTVSFSPDGGEIAAISRDSKIRFWAVPGGKLIRSIDLPS